MYVPNGHTYDVYRGLSDREVKLVDQKLKELTDTEAQNQQNMVKLDRWEKDNCSESEPATKEALEEHYQILSKGLDILGRSERIRAELTGMLDMALQNCLNLTQEQIRDIDLNERIGIFKEIVKISQESIVSGSHVPKGVQSLAHPEVRDIACHYQRREFLLFR